jgi:energy-coupling factor transport system permease protein
LLAVYHCGGLGFGFFWRKLRVILVFGLMLFLVQAIFRTGGVLFVELDLGFTQLRIWSKGLAQGGVMALRFVNVIAASYAFVATTNPNEFALGLMQAGLPYRHGFMLIAALRFIPVFQHELGQIRAAQMAKGIDLRRLSPSKLLMVVRYLFMPLVVSALTKVDTLTVSMEGRAFGLYDERTYRRKLPLTSRDKWVFALGLLLICSLHFGSWWLRLRL